MLGGSPVTESFNMQNQISGDDYDANGNDQTIGAGGATYDAWNRLITVPLNVADETNGMQYAYDALGRRVSEVAARWTGHCRCRSLVS